MYKYIRTKQDLNFTEFIDGLSNNNVVYLDVEATSLDPFSCTWLLLQLKIGEQIYIFDARNLDKSTMCWIVDQIIAGEKLVVGHNIKYDAKVIYCNTGRSLLKLHDTMLVESFIGQGLGDTFYSLDYLVNKYCNISLDKEVRNSFIGYNGEITEEQLIYSAMDVMYLSNVYAEQMKEVDIRKMHKIYDLEMSLIPAVISMELAGILIDVDAWTKLKQNAESQIAELSEKIVKIFSDNIDFTKFGSALDVANYFVIPEKGKANTKNLETITDIVSMKLYFNSKFNIASNQQMKNALRLVFGLILPNVNENTLKDTNDKIIVPSIVEYREWNKKYTTYGDKFLENINPVTGRIHSEFLQNGADSGRFSSSSPNMQNIPRNSEYRKCFIAGTGKKFISADFNQQEYRLAGALSKDKAIIDSYLQGKDMHTATAAIIHKKGLNDVTKEERALGKTINFAVLYGSTAYGLSYKLKISQEQADDILSKFADGYKSLMLFKRLVEKAIWDKKYSSTILGRIRRFQNKTLFADYREARSYEGSIKREGFNHIIQGTGADVTKLAMIEMFYNNPFGDKFKLILQVHDEIVAEVADDIANEAQKFMEESMIKVFQPLLGEIPAVVESKISCVWEH